MVQVSLLQGDDASSDGICRGHPLGSHSGWWYHRIGFENKKLDKVKQRTTPSNGREKRAAQGGCYIFVKMTNKALFAFLLLLPMSLLQAAEGSEMSGCRTLKLSEHTVSDNRVYRLNDTMSFSIGDDSTLDTQNDYGARFMLLKQSAGVSSRIYYSTGSNDSYGMRPTFIANCGENELLVFGETGSEYSWGLRVFSYNG
jgi:hypothetical protein